MMNDERRMSGFGDSGSLPVERKVEGGGEVAGRGRQGDRLSRRALAVALKGEFVRSSVEPPVNVEARRVGNGKIVIVSGDEAERLRVASGGRRGARSNGDDGEFGEVGSEARAVRKVHSGHKFISFRPGVY